MNSKLRFLISMVYAFPILICQAQFSVKYFEIKAMFDNEMAEYKRTDNYGHLTNAFALAFSLKYTDVLNRPVNVDAAITREQKNAAQLGDTNATKHFLALRLSAIRQCYKARDLKYDINVSRVLHVEGVFIPNTNDVKAVVAHQKFVQDTQRLYEKDCRETDLERTIERGIFQLRSFTRGVVDGKEAQARLEANVNEMIPEKELRDRIFRIVSQTSVKGS